MVMLLDWFPIYLEMEDKRMDLARFRDWFSNIDELTATIKLGINKERRCLYKSCGQTFALKSHKGERRI